jgi:hypothetical protein
MVVLIPRALVTVSSTRMLNERPAGIWRHCDFQSNFAPPAIRRDVRVGCPGINEAAGLFDCDGTKAAAIGVAQP